MVESFTVPNLKRWKINRITRCWLIHQIHSFTIQSWNELISFDILQNCSLRCLFFWWGTLLVYSKHFDLWVSYSWESAHRLKLMKMEPLKITQLKSGKSSEPNLHDFGFRSCNHPRRAARTTSGSKNKRCSTSRKHRCGRIWSRWNNWCCPSFITPQKTNMSPKKALFQ